MSKQKLELTKRINEWQRHSKQSKRIRTQWNNRKRKRVSGSKAQKNRLEIFPIIIHTFIPRCIMTVVESLSSLHLLAFLPLLPICAYSSFNRSFICLLLCMPFCRCRCSAHMFFIFNLTYHLFQILIFFRRACFCCDENNFRFFSSRAVLSSYNPIFSFCRVLLRPLNPPRTAHNVYSSQSINQSIKIYHRWNSMAIEYLYFSFSFSIRILLRIHTVWHQEKSNHNLIIPWKKTERENIEM